jgi:hypothetical protein
MLPAIEGMAREGVPFTGFLYAGSDDDGRRAEGFGVSMYGWGIQRRRRCYTGWIATSGRCWKRVRGGILAG